MINIEETHGKLNETIAMIGLLEEQRDKYVRDLAEARCPFKIGERIVQTYTTRGVLVEHEVTRIADDTEGRFFYARRVNKSGDLGKTESYHSTGYMVKKEGV